MNTITLNYNDPSTAERVAKYLNQQGQNQGTFTAQGNQVQCNWRSEQDIARVLSSALEEATIVQQLIERHRQQPAFSS